MDRLQLTAVYCNRRGGVNTTPQMTCFRGASVQNMATGKSDNQLIQPHNKLKIGTRSGKLRIGHDYVVTLHDANTNDDMTIFTDFHNV